jgi:ZIP family zinc transporter
VLDAVALGVAAQSSLIVSGLVVYVVRVPPRIVGAIAGFGSGALIGAIAFELIPESRALAGFQLSLWLLAGAGVFVVSDRIVERHFHGPTGSGALGIVVGAVVDGIPESMMFGIQVAAGTALSGAFVAAVWVSNISEALAPSAELADSGWSKGRMAAMWGSVVAACGVASGLGFVFARAFGTTGSRAATLAAGGLLAMLTDSLIPFAYDRAGLQAGIWTVVGFAVALALA